MTLKSALKVVVDSRYILTPFHDGECQESVRIDYLSKDREQFALAISQRDIYAAMKTRVKWVHYNKAAECIEIIFDII